MIFFTTFVTIVRPEQQGTQRRLGSPARVEGNTIRLPIGTEVQLGDQVEHRLPNDEPRLMVVIDVIHPHMEGANAIDDHIEITCVPIGPEAIPQGMAPALHYAMSASLALVEQGRMSEAVVEALRLVEDRIRYLAGSDESGVALMESVFGARPTKLDVTTTTGEAAEDEQEGFRLLFIGAMLGLRGPQGAGSAVPAALDETLEYLAVASMLMRRLDRAESGLS